MFDLLVAWYSKWQKEQSLNNQILFWIQPNRYLSDCDINSLNKIKMGCQASHSGEAQIPKARPSIPSQVANLIASSKFQQAEKIAEDLFKRHEVTVAIAAYQKIIESNYLHDYLIQGTGNYQLAVGLYQGCIYDYYQKGVSSRKFNGNPYDALSLCYCYLRSQHEQALKDGILWYQEMLGNVESYQLYAGYANILANCKKYRHALKAYNKAIELRPTLINAHVSIAFIQEYGKKDHEKSEEIAKKLISLYPDNMYAQLILAKSEKDITSQIDKLKEIGIKHPEYVRITFQIGQAFEKKKDYKQAIYYYRKSLQTAPLFVSCLFSIGNAYNFMKQQSEALIWYLKTFQLNSHYEGLHLSICNTLENLKYTVEQFQNQIKKYEKLNHYSLNYLLGVAYYQKSMIQSAIKWFHKAEKLNSNEASLLNYIAMSYDEKQDFANAEKYYEKCIEEHPKYPNAYYNLAILYKHAKNQAKAGFWFKKAIQVNPRYRYTSELQGQKNLKILNTNQHKTSSNPLSFLTNMFNFGKPKLQPINSQQLSQEIIIPDKKQVNQRQLPQPNEQQAKLVEQIFQMFNSKSKSRGENSSFKPQILDTIKLIHEDKFQLKKIDKIYDLVKKLIHEDEQFFHIIPQLIVQHFHNQLFVHKKSPTQVQKETSEIIAKIFDKQANEQLSPIKMHQIVVKIKHYTPPNQVKVNLLKKAQKILTYDNICSQITKVIQSAEKTLSEFIDLVEDVRMRSNGIQFIAKVKIPNYQIKQFRYLFPVISSVFKEDLNGMANNIISSSIFEQITKFGSQGLASETIAKIQKIWSNQITSLLSQKQKTNVQPELNITDLIKGKVTFNSIQDLSRGLQVTDNICFIRGYEIICLKNRLTNRDTKDILLTIKIRETVSEFSLTLKHNEDGLQLKQFLQEIQSPLGSIIGSYIFLAQKISYPLIMICKDVQSQFKENEGKDEKELSKATKYIIEALQKQKVA